MFTVLALLARIVSNPLANMLQKKNAEFNSSFAINLFTSFFMFVLISPFGFTINFFRFSCDFYILVFLSGFLCFLGTLCLIKALSLGEMSVLGPVNSYKSVIGLLGAFFILGEIPSNKSIIGFLIIIFASFLFQDENGRFLFNKSVVLRLSALIFTGMEAVILKKIILLSNPETCLFFWVVTSFMFSFLAAIIFKKTKIENKKTIFDCLKIAILLLLMQYSTNYVFKHLEVGLSLSLFQLSNVIALIIGFKIFNEKNVLKKSIGTLLMLFGSILILK